MKTSEACCSATLAGKPEPTCFLRPSDLGPVRVCGRCASISTFSSRGFGELNFRTVDGGSEDGRWSAKCEGEDEEEPQAETLTATEDFGVLETRYLVMSRSPFVEGEFLGEGWADRGGHVQLWVVTCIPSREFGRARVDPDSAARIGRFPQQCDTRCSG